MISSEELGDFMKKLLTLSGNIGVGKTTLGKHLSDRATACWLPENAYSAQFEHLIIDTRCSNKTIMQMAFSSMRVATILSALLDRNNQHVVAERSIRDSIVFHKAWVKIGSFEDDWNFYSEFYEKLFRFDLNDYNYDETIIWLKCPIPILLERLSKRSQISDMAHTENLLYALESEYNEMFHMISGKCNIIEFETQNIDLSTEGINEFTTYVMASI